MTSQEAAALKDYMTSVVRYETHPLTFSQSYTVPPGKPRQRNFSSDKEKISLVCRDEQCG